MFLFFVRQGIKDGNITLEPVTYIIYSVIPRYEWERFRWTPLQVPKGPPEHPRPVKREVHLVEAQPREALGAS